jgi:hypothetical protein
MIRVTGSRSWHGRVSHNHIHGYRKHIRLREERLARQGPAHLTSNPYASSAPALAGEIVAASNAYALSCDRSGHAMATARASRLAAVTIDAMPTSGAARRSDFLKHRGAS